MDKQEGKPYSVSVAKAKLVCTDAKNACYY